MLSCFPNAIRWPVGAELVAAATRLVDVLGFTIRERSEGSVLLDNGALSIRLVGGPSAETLAIEATCADLDVTVAALVAAGGAAATRLAVGDAWLEQTITLPPGLVLTLRHEIPEERRRVLPALPKSLPWTDDAETTLQSLLGSVPGPFRDLARRRATACSEAIAQTTGAPVVTREHAADGFVQATPAFGRVRARDAVAALGITHAAGATADPPNDPIRGPGAPS